MEIEAIEMYREKVLLYVQIKDFAVELSDYADASAGVEKAVMSGSISETLNFMRQVELNRTIEGVYPISKLARLSESLLDKDGDAKVKLQFCHSAGFACLKGTVSAALTLECQRCLDPIEREVVGEFNFALVCKEEDFELIPEGLDPYLIEGEEQSIVDLIEDELLLSIPMVTIHDTPCSDFMTEHELALKAEKEASHPFAALKSLKEDEANNGKVN